MSNDALERGTRLATRRIWILQDLEAGPPETPDRELALTGILCHSLTLLGRFLDRFRIDRNALVPELLHLPGREQLHVGPLQAMPGGHWRGRAFVRDAEFGLELRLQGSPAANGDVFLQGRLEWGGLRQEFLIRCENR